MLSSIDYNPEATWLENTRIFRSAFNRVAEIFRTNKPYLHYQIAFMFYGIAFMMTNSVITIFYDRAVGLNYSSVAFYKNFYNLIAIFLLPVFGRILAHTDPRRFATLTYSFLALYLLSFPALLRENLLLTYFTCFPSRLRCCTRAILKLWGFRSITCLWPEYCSTVVLLPRWPFRGVSDRPISVMPNEAGDYQSVHLSLTGLRAMFIPLAGVFLYDIAGFTFTFFNGCDLNSQSTGSRHILILEWSGRKYRLTK
jgi:hypothetical protein